MGDDLVAVEIEINPDVGAAAFGTTQDLAVKAAGFLEVANREGDVERTQLTHKISYVILVEVLNPQVRTCWLSGIAHVLLCHRLLSIGHFLHQ